MECVAVLAFKLGVAPVTDVLAAAALDVAITAAGGLRSVAMGALCVLTTELTAGALIAGVFFAATGNEARVAALAAPTGCFSLPNSHPL